MNVTPVFSCFKNIFLSAGYLYTPCNINFISVLFILYPESKNVNEKDKPIRRRAKMKKYYAIAISFFILTLAAAPLLALNHAPAEPPKPQLPTAAVPADPDSEYTFDRL